jgi:translation initiation factor IF-2
MEGMLAPETQEVIVGNAELREVFKISKVGTIAGCMVTDGYIKRQNPTRLIRDGIVLYSGKLSSLKRFKDDVGEVRSGFDCGIGIDGFNDLNVGDVLESFEIREVKRKL